jgi:inhibitor of Bruton tyrosine kinase
MVQQNQLAFLPFAKSGRAEADLLEQHADLAGALAQARERKIDSMRLRSRLHEDEERSASLHKFRVGSWGRTSSFPAKDQTSRTSPKQSMSPALSPALLDQDVGSELLFEMDEEKAGRRDGPIRRSNPTSPELPVHDLATSLEVGSPNGEGNVWSNARGKPVSGSLSTDASSLGSSFPRPQCSSSPATSRAPQDSALMPELASQNAPWSEIKSTSGKRGLKDIMAEASVSRPSNLTLAMNAETSERTGGIQKMSQKERKKMQKQQLLQKDEVDQASTSSTPKSTALTRPTPTSPWRLIRPSPKPDLNQPFSSEIGRSAASTELPVRPPMRTMLTMRQTVAGTPAPNKSQLTSSGQAHSVSTPTVTPSKPTPPHIQSIRHTPAPATTSLSYATQSSMSDILLQQQTEKMAVKEAVAKRSLQEIQQQQEFEEWFDSESRRVQEEEAQATAAAATTTRDGRGKRGRGRGHRRGIGRGRTKAGDESYSTSPTTDRTGSAHRQDSQPGRGNAPSLRAKGRASRRDGP